MKKIILYTGLGLLWAVPAARGQGMKIMPATTFKLTGGSYTMVLSGDVGLQSQSAMQTGDLILKATGTGPGNIGSAGTLAIRELQVNKTAGASVVLQSPLFVSEGVFFNSGYLDLNGDNLVLADTGMLVNESSSSYALGNSGGAVQISVNLDAPLAENPGNLGLVITSGASWGNTVIRRRHQAFTGPGGGSSIQRSYEIVPANNTGLNAFLRMYYLDNELNSLNEGALDFFRSDNGGAQWTNIGSSGRNTTQNFVNVNGVQSMSLFTLSTTNNPLPVTFSKLNASCLHNRAMLQWSLGSIQGLVAFVVEKSRNGADWVALPGRIDVQADAGYSYSFTDVQDVYPYYRLQCQERDGKLSWSPVLPVDCATEGYVFTLLQNPVQDVLRFSVRAGTELTAVLTLYDLQGRTAYTAQVNIPAGYSEQHMPLPALAEGMYQIRLDQGGGQLWQTRLVKR